MNKVFCRLDDSLDWSLLCLDIFEDFEDMLVEY